MPVKIWGAGKFKSLSHRHISCLLFCISQSHPSCTLETKSKWKSATQILRSICMHYLTHLDPCFISAISTISPASRLRSQLSVNSICQAQPTGRTAASRKATEGAFKLGAFRTSKKNSRFNICSFAGFRFKVHVFPVRSVDV